MAHTTVGSSPSRIVELVIPGASEAAPLACGRFIHRLFRDRARILFLEAEALYSGCRIVRNERKLNRRECRHLSAEG